MDAILSPESSLASGPGAHGERIATPAERSTLMANAIRAL